MAWEIRVSLEADISDWLAAYHPHVESIGVCILTSYNGGFIPSVTECKTIMDSHDSEEVAKLTSQLTSHLNLVANNRVLEELMDILRDSGYSSGLITIHNPIYKV